MNIFAFLGAVISPIYLESDHYIPDRTLQRIDRMTSSMMEYGLFEFYTNFAAFKQKFIERIYLSEEDGDPQALTMGQLKRPAILLVALCAFAAIILIVEIVIFKWQNWRQHRE